MSTLFKLWDKKGEPFEVPANRRAKLLAEGWTTTKPQPKAPEAPQPKRSKFSAKRVQGTEEEVNDD
jgi:hypothetical protein